MKVEIYNTSDMSGFLFEIFLRNTTFIEDGVTEYNVGAYSSEYEDADDKENYDLMDVELSKKLDEHFISLGAKNGENVLVYHGTYKQF